MPAHSDEAVAVIVLNWNNAADTIACIESLLRMDRDVAIIVVDNASTDGSASQIDHWALVELPKRNRERATQGREPYLAEREWARPAGEVRYARPRSAPVCVIHFVQTGSNLGYAGGNNAGLRSAMPHAYAYFWILNNDTRVATDALSKALERIASNPEIGLCGSTLVYDEAPTLVQCRGGGSFQRLTGRPGQIGGLTHISDPVDLAAIERRMRYVNGAATLVRRQFIDEIGLMDEGYFLYFEELDWAVRAKGKYRLAYAPESIIRHKVGASIGTDDRGGEGSDLAAYYMTRNRIRFCLLHSKMSVPFVALDVIRSMGSAWLKGRQHRLRVISAAALSRPLPQDA
jgi:GT2 family glycosyltransferase